MHTHSLFQHLKFYKNPRPRTIKALPKPYTCNCYNWTHLQFVIWSHRHYSYRPYIPVLALEPLYVTGSMYSGQKHGLWLAKVCGAMDLKISKLIVCGTFKPLQKMPSPRFFFKSVLSLKCNVWAHACMQLTFWRYVMI
jgi:hypothetical protein